VKSVGEMGRCSWTPVSSASPKKSQRDEYAERNRVMARLRETKGSGRATNRKLPDGRWEQHRGDHDRSMEGKIGQATESTRTHPQIGSASPFLRGEPFVDLPPPPFYYAAARPLSLHTLFVVI
jgi:hypothetical protein